MQYAQHVEVAVAVPVANLFTYGVGEGLSNGIEAGQLVEVPFGRGTRRGVVVETAVGPPPAGVQVKAVDRLVETDPVISQTLLQTLRWAADYYLAPPGEMIFTALPPSFRHPKKATGGRRVLTARLAGEIPDMELERLGRRAPLQARLVAELGDGQVIDVAELGRFGKGVRGALNALQAKGLVRLEKETRARRPAAPVLPLPPRIESLTAHQQRALDAIKAALAREEYAAFLLHGVTGSGKTEVYLRAIEKTLAQGRGAVLLVPEISLTPQLLARVNDRLGPGVAVLHSGLSSGERLDEWRRLNEGRAMVAVGARSAVFAPVRRPGLLIVDEEHDSSYKQSERLPYNGRDMAMVRARDEGAVVLMGTATPSVESYANAESGKSTLLNLPHRVHERPMPRVEIVDLKKDLPDPVERAHSLGRALAGALAETLDRKEQAILFLNRRGYSSFVLCKDCGQSVRCTNCSVALVHHSAVGQLKCHYCGLAIPVPETCPGCGSARMQHFGLGTEKCTEEVRRRFPGARVLRMDSDSTARSGALHEMMSSFAGGEADVMVGTQMVTKGHDLPGVTLVGVLLADLGLHLPDFRALERTFQLIMQVAGRAGRGDRPGRVIVQTFLPRHESIVLASKNDFVEFYRKELERRRALAYPPAGRLLLVRVSHPDAGVAGGLAAEIAGRIRSSERGKVSVLGPVESPLARLRGRYRFQLLVKAPTVEALLGAAVRVRPELRPPPRAKILFDVDPLDML